MSIFNYFSGEELIVLALVGLVILSAVKGKTKNNNRDNSRGHNSTPQE